jgi:hypothetical protein
MLPAPPWMISRGVMLGFALGCDLYSIAADELCRMADSSGMNVPGARESQGRSVGRLSTYVAWRLCWWGRRRHLYGRAYLIVIAHSAPIADWITRQHELLERTRKYLKCPTATGTWL